MNSFDILRARAYYYEFLSYPFFFHDKDEKSFINFKEQAKFLATNSICDEENFNKILSCDFKKFSTEQNAVLFDLSYANVPLCASFYDEGRDSGKKRVQTIEILKQSKYRRNLNFYNESEDFVGFLFLFMSKFLQDENLGDENAKICANEMFKNIINPFIDELCELLNAHKEAVIFKALSSITSAFMALEREIYNLKAPLKGGAESVAKMAMQMRPHVSKMPTAKSKIHWEEFTKI